MSNQPGPVEVPSPGERIGPYEIVRRLGTGGMGVVFEAVDTALRRRVALKVIAPHLAGDPAFRVRFTQEAQAQASLDSPHVVQVFAHGEADGALYIASQLIPGGDLGAIIRSSGAPPPHIALDIITQVATGLADAHATGLIHRDIKPANVLVRIRGDEVSAYLADFGIARRADVDPTITTQSFAIGTPGYMAPELHTGGTPGATADIYALGCLLWAALVGSAPYSGATDDRLPNAHLSAPVPQLATFGAWEQQVNAILRRAMAKSPSARYPSACALRDDLRRLQRDVLAPTAVRPGTGLEQAVVRAPQAARSRVPWVVAVVVVAVLVLVGGAVRLVAALDGDDGGGGDAGNGDDLTSATTNEHGLTADEQESADHIAAALVLDGDFEDPDATCTARRLVQESGIEGLQEKGIIDEDLAFVADSGEGIDPNVLADIITVSVACVFETVALGGMPSAG